MDYRLKKAIEKTAQLIENDERFWTGALEVRAEGLAHQYPHDPTVVGMYRYLKGQSQKNPLISRAELQDAYRRLAGRSTVFKDNFSTELGSAVKLAEPKRIQHDEFEGKAFNFGVDADLAKTISNLFETSAHNLSDGTVKKAEEVCLKGMNRFSYKPHSLTALASSEDGVVCSVSYETPKGMVNVIVPLEVEKELGPLFPTAFVSSAGFVELTEENLNHYLQVSAGKKIQVEAKVVLQAIKTAKRGMADPVEAELDSIIARAKMSTPSVDMNGIVGVKIDDEIVDTLPYSEETASFAEKLASVGGEAEFLLGKKTVEAADRSLRGKLASLGYRNAKVKISSYNKDSIVFSANVDNQAAFTVQASLKGGVVELAKMVVANGNLYSFSSEGLNEMMSQGLDTVALAAASSVSGLSNHQLIEVVKKAMADDNWSAAEEAIHQIQLTGDTQSHKIAFAHYMNGMNGGMVKEASHQHTDSCCSMKRKVASSKYEVCGHTGLPLHKVYQNQYGECLPLYRKSSAEPSSPMILQHKIEWT